MTWLIVILCITTIVAFAGRNKSSARFVSTSLGYSDEDEEFVDDLYTQDEKSLSIKSDDREDEWSFEDEDEDEDLELTRIEDDEIMEEMEALLSNRKIVDRSNFEDWLDSVRARKLYSMRRLNKRIEQRLEQEGF